MTDTIFIEWGADSFTPSLATRYRRKSGQAEYILKSEYDKVLADHDAMRYALDELFRELEWMRK